jgi:hypothetical protein
LPPPIAQAVSNGSFVLSTAFLGLGAYPCP